LLNPLIHEAPMLILSFADLFPVVVSCSAAVDFFNEISMLYGTISEYCTNASCPQMAAGDCRYLWADKKTTKPVECSAPEYVDNLMGWVESQLNDETVFPIKFDSSYPKKFKEICSTIYKRFFRVYAHIYHAHFKQIQTLGADAHLNTCFKHFMYFVLEFKVRANTHRTAASFPLAWLTLRCPCLA